MNTTSPIRILALAGSLRRESLNRKALRLAVQIAEESGADVKVIDLKTLNLPVFDEDLRAKGFPPAVQELKQAIQSSDLLLIATPEYNHSIPGPLKNTIDWASDKTNPFEGKVAAIFGASSGLNGTIRAQTHLRQVLAALKVLLLPQPQVFIRSAQKAFDPDGSLVDRQVYNQLKELVAKTISFTSKLKKENPQ